VAAIYSPDRLHFGFRRGNSTPLDEQFHHCTKELIYAISVPYTLYLLFVLSASISMVYLVILWQDLLPFPLSSNLI